MCFLRVGIQWLQLTLYLIRLMSCIKLYLQFFLLMIGSSLVIFAVIAAYTAYHIVKLKNDLQNAATDAMRSLLLEKAPGLIKTFYLKLRSKKVSKNHPE